MRARRESRLGQNSYGTRQSQSSQDVNSSHRPAYSNPFVSNEGQHRRPRPNRAHKSSGGETDEEEDVVTDSHTPLLSSSHRERPQSRNEALYGMFGNQHRGSRPTLLPRRSSVATSSSSKRKRLPSADPTSTTAFEYDVNNPPSVPNTPKLGSDTGFDDVLNFAPSSPLDRRATAPTLGDHLIDVDVDGDGMHDNTFGNSSPPTPRRISTEQRRRTMAFPAEDDVCFPLEGMSEMADDDYEHGDHSHHHNGGAHHRRRARQWPDLSVLEEWSREEKEVRSEGIRAKKISEPVLVGGRLRPQKNGWHRLEEDAPYRFTYFNEEFQSTTHSQTISELVQAGQTFKDLFIPDLPELNESDSEEEEEEDMSYQENGTERGDLSPGSKAGTRQTSVIGGPKPQSKENSGHATPAPSQTQQPSHDQQQKEKPKRYGARPTFWLDVLSPTETEMRVISKTFGIHPLTAEDIMVQEAREKVELFRNYYFVNYRTFEQDQNSEDYLEPVNMYVVVFREGVISFHFSMTPHPANVRRRIRQLKDYLILSSDWISYAIIDDITDVFAPLIQSVEEEVDDLDDSILQLHAGGEKADNSNNKRLDRDNEKRSETGEATSPDSGGDMLRRIGQGRKKVMGLYRLLGNKADVIKGFAKRCNEQWEIAPRSEIGLYLGDIQDHILTMTSNLSHYETYV